MSLYKRGGEFCPENNNNGTPVAPGDRKYAVRISTQTFPHPLKPPFRSLKSLFLRAHCR